MGDSDDSRQIHFHSPENLVDRLDAIAELFGMDRTDLLVEAIREYVQETADDETFQQRVATKYYEDELEFETVKQLVGVESASDSVSLRRIWTAKRLISPLRTTSTCMTARFARPTRKSRFASASV